MKILNTVAALFLLIAGLYSCQTREQKPDDAFEHIKEQKREIVDSVLHAREAVPMQKQADIQKQADVQKKTETADVWVHFRTDMEAKILVNEAKIKTLKGAKETNTKSFRRIARLEKDNQDLRAQMDGYVKDEKIRQEKFRVTLLSDEKEIEASLKDIGTTTK
ncbi:MAG TPA: hypothetical protein VNZ86_04305 [Bacteroidia bacterium]|nr:hypothetical protein [Bacteroidia bacterium]